MTAAIADADVARLHAPGVIRVAREGSPEPGPGEVVLRVTAVGLCGSDLHWYQEGSIGDARLSRASVTCVGDRSMTATAKAPETTQW